MPDAHKNFAYSAVATAPSPATTGLSLVVTAGDGAGFGTPPFNAVVCPAGAIPTRANAEVVRVTGVATDTLTIVRQQEGSSARTITVGDTIFAGDTVKTFTDIENAQGAALQPGAIASGDAALTINSITQVTIAAAAQFWLTNAAGILVPVAIASTVLGSIAAAATYTRLDQVVVDANGAVSRLAGVETNGATLANRTGAASIPSGSRLLHDILVTTGGVLVAGVRDRRPWARGGYSKIVRLANAGGGNDYSTSSGTGAAVDATNLAIRLECSGVPIRVTARGRWSGNGGVAIFVDGALPAEVAGSGWLYSVNSGSEWGLDFAWDLTGIGAGSHLFQPSWFAFGGTVTWYAKANLPALFTVEELVRVNANNGTS